MRALGQDLVLRLRAQGFRVFHALEMYPKGTRDSLVFAAAQQRGLTVFTWNRDDYALLAYAWGDWGHGDHFGMIARRKDQPQLGLTQVFPVLERYCRDTSSFVNRIELF